MKKVTIIVPCYNQAAYLDDCFQSVLEQSYSNWECLMINDGSTDNTDKILSEWEQKDTRFKKYSKKNGGLSSARNYGLQHAEGDAIQFLDSDDVLKSEKLEQSVQFLNEDFDIVISSFYRFTNEEIKRPYCNLAEVDFTYDEILNKWEKGFTIPIHCAIFSKEIIGDIQFQESIKSFEDWIFWIAIMSRKPKVKYIDTQLAGYRINQNSLTANKFNMYLSYHKAIAFILENFEITDQKKFMERNFPDNDRKLNYIINHQEKVINYYQKSSLRYWIDRIKK